MILESFFSVFSLSTWKYGRICGFIIKEGSSCYRRPATMKMQLFLHHLTSVVGIRMQHTCPVDDWLERCHQWLTAPQLIQLTRWDTDINLKYIIWRWSNARYFALYRSLEEDTIEASPLTIDSLLSLMTVCGHKQTTQTYILGIFNSLYGPLNHINNHLYRLGQHLDRM